MPTFSFPIYPTTLQFRVISLRKLFPSRHVHPRKFITVNETRAPTNRSWTIYQGYITNSYVASYHDTPAPKACCSLSTDPCRKISTVRVFWMRVSRVRKESVTFKGLWKMKRYFPLYAWYTPNDQLSHIYIYIYHVFFSFFHSLIQLG